MNRDEFYEARRKYREARSAIRWTREQDNNKYADNKGGGVLFDALWSVTDFDIRESCHQQHHHYFEVNKENARWTMQANSRGLMINNRKGVSV